MAMIPVDSRELCKVVSDRKGGLQKRLSALHEANEAATERVDIEHFDKQDISDYAYLCDEIDFLDGLEGLCAYSKQVWLTGEELRRVGRISPSAETLSYIADIE